MSEKQILEQSIRDHKQAIATAEAKLAELDKPKLRHGDYGFSDLPRYPRLLVGDRQLVNAQHIFDRQSQDDITVVLGNIFDDLKFYGQDADELLRWYGRYGSYVKGNIRPAGLTTSGEWGVEVDIKNQFFAPDDLIDAAKHLMQLAYTAKRRQK